MARQASLLVADEILFTLLGKAVLQGIYTTDLFIAADPTPLPQLIFFFIAGTDASDPFKSLAAQVTLPGSDPATQLIPILVPPPSERTKLFVRYPMLLSAPILRPGRILAKMIHENGEIPVSAPWIVPAASLLEQTKVR
jgi:hypothetical protein